MPTWLYFPGPGTNFNQFKLTKLKGIRWEPFRADRVYFAQALWKIKWLKLLVFEWFDKINFPSLDVNVINSYFPLKGKFFKKYRSWNNFCCVLGDFRLHSHRVWYIAQLALLIICSRAWIVNQFKLPGVFSIVDNNELNWAFWHI